MKKRTFYKTITYVLLLVLVLGIVTGCAGGGTQDDAPYFHSSLNVKEDTQEVQLTETTEDVEETDLYLIVEINQIEESMRLFRYANGMEYRYYYGTNTRFYDKYGGRTNVMKFVVGAAVTLGDVDGEGILREARISDAVWTYDDVSRFSIEEERRVFEIAGSKYKYDNDSIYVFSGAELISMSDVAQGDTLSVVGKGKDILSVRVTTGQGVLALKNTELFEGSFLQLGTRIFAEITPDMQLTVEEGTYNLIVASNGWGGNREITITRGETLTVDLDELKGEGPKIGKILFVIDVADAVLVLDGETREYTEPIELSYGRHSLAVYANGYDEWERNLYVNSEEATIVIQLEDEKAEVSATEKSSEKDSQTSSEKKNDSKTERERRQEEVDLIKDLLTSNLF